MLRVSLNVCTQLCVSSELRSICISVGKRVADSAPRVSPSVFARESPGNSTSMSWLLPTSVPESTRMEARVGISARV